MTEDNRKVRVGVIGAGRWANLVHIPGIKSHENAELIALSCRTRSTLESTAQKFNIPKTFTDYHELIKSGDLDAVVIVTPTVTHYPMTMAALEQGLHVFCEKPLGMNYKEAVQMYKAAENAEVKHMVVFSSRFLPHSKRMKELIDQGSLGPLYHLNINKMAGYAAAETPFKWRFDIEKSGSGVLGDLGSHVIDLSRWYLGEISRVCGHLPTYIRERKALDSDQMNKCYVDDASAFIAEFENGLQGVFHISWLAHKGRVQRVELCGHKGVLVYDSNPEGWELSLKRSTKEDETLREVPIPKRLTQGIDESTPEKRFRTFVENYPSYSRRFIDVIVNDEEPSPSFYDGMKTQEVMEAIQLSARQGRWVCLPLQGGV